MKQFITDTIVNAVNSHKGKITYRTPLVGFASAEDPGFLKLKEAVGPGHLLPEDLLDDARSVVAFFLPFQPQLTATNRKDPYVARDWAEAYIETNSLISSICENLQNELDKRGVKAAWQRPTHNFDPQELVSFWSHKHVAYLCGLGTFGLHHMLITSAGCGGRIGSLVVNCHLPASIRPQEEYCLYRSHGKCAVCVKTCPTGALTVEGLNKQRCYQQLLEVDAHYSDLGLCDVCGKCATGPCAARLPIL